MRSIALLLLGCTVATAQRILPPALDASGRTVFIGSSFFTDALSFDLYAFDAKGQHPLTQLAAGNYAFDPITFAINRDGSQLAYGVTTATGPVVRTVDVSSGASTSLPAPTGFFEPASIHFVDPGKQILVTAQTRRQMASVTYLFAADGSATTIKILDGVLASSPQRVTSKNGFVVFTGDPRYTQDPNPRLARLDGSGVRTLTDFPFQPNVYPRKIAGDATISTSGVFVLFATTEGSEQGAPSQVWTVLGDGSGLRALTALDEGCHSPSLSSDGLMAAFICKGQVNVERTDGTARQILTDFHWSAAANPVISEDGSSVAFTIEPAGLYGVFYPGAVWSVKTDGTELKPIYAPRVISSVQDALTFGDATPGGFIAVYGYNLSTDSLTVAGAPPLPESLNGASLWVNGRAVPILAVSPWQINAQLPNDLPAGYATFQFLFRDGSSSNLIFSRLAPNSAYIFGLPGNGCTNVFHAATGMPADAAHPAQAGETVAIYAAGLGLTDPVVPAGVPAPSSPPAKLINPITIYIVEPGVEVSPTAPVVFAGLAPGTVGIYQINATIPKGLRPGIKNFILRLDSGGMNGNGCFF